MAIRQKSLDGIEAKLQAAEPGSLRYRILESAKHFKTSWVELAQALYSVWKDKVYKEWGYAQFDTFTSREIGIKKQTAMKLLRSYYFLEKEEPAYLRKGYAESTETAAIPTYETIDVLRQAKSKRMLDENDYEDFKKRVFEKGKDARDLKQDLTALIRERKELMPQEAREERRAATLKRFLSVMKSLTQEIESAKFLPASVVKEAQQLLKHLESEIS